MRVYSFIQSGIELVPIEIEVSLVPGLPGIQILGQPDSVIKESEPKIKSALRFQGFELPKSQRVLINLRPHYLKKSSKGIELALATAIIWKTEQLEMPEILQDVKEIYIYGELSLEGKVSFNEDLRDSFFKQKPEVVITGYPKQGSQTSILAVNELRDLTHLELVIFEKNPMEYKRPSLDKTLLFNSQTSELLSVAAVGEHSMMLAGPAGSGKTTLAEAFHTLLSEPIETEIEVSHKISKIMGRDLGWRPLVSPHHSTTPLAMIGGGQKLFPGEISRAHHGVLLMDEYLEFHPKVQESLREPMEKGEIHITRMGRAKCFPAQFILVATTNLCPCGDLIPGKMNNCQRSLFRCRSYIEKLSGPVLDRFDILSMITHSKKESKVNLECIYKNIQRAQEFALKDRHQKLKNSKLSEEELLTHTDEFVKKVLLNENQGSRRRKRSLLRVARSIADLETSSKIMPHHIERSLCYSVYPFESLKRVFA